MCAHTAKFEFFLSNPVEFTKYWEFIFFNLVNFMKFSEIFNVFCNVSETDFVIV